MKNLKIWLALLAALAVVFAAGCDTSGDGGGSSGSSFGCGKDETGTSQLNGNTYDIYDLAGLIEWASNHSDKDAVLHACITWQADESAGHTSWSPVGSDSDPYTGTFDGDGHTVYDITIGANGSYAGFFGYVGSEGTVQDLGVEIGSFSDGASSAGGIAGFNNGAITVCWSVGDVTGNGDQASYAGGIVGQNSGTITACYWDGNVSAGSNGGSSADNTTKVDGSSGNTWKDAETAMNGAIDNLAESIDWKYDGATTTKAPTLKKSGS